MWNTCAARWGRPASVTMEVLMKEDQFPSKGSSEPTWALTSALNVVKQDASKITMITQALFT